jgi:hypothetical protein
VQQFPESEFLLEAVRNMEWHEWHDWPEWLEHRPRASSGARMPDQGRAEWVIELFLRLEQSERGTAR